MMRIFLKKGHDSLCSYELHYLATMITLSKNIHDGVDHQIIDEVVNQMIGYLKGGLLTGHLSKDQYIMYMNDLNSLKK